MAGTGGGKMKDEPIPRVAKGKRPVYFNDPAIDKLMTMLLVVIEELSVTRERLDALERTLAGQDSLDRNALDNYKPDASAMAERDAARAAYIARVMRVVTMELQKTDASGATEAFSSTLRQMLEEGGEQ
jgi:biopolymer transport protein ExbB/TolQ